MNYSQNAEFLIYLHKTDTNKYKSQTFKINEY